MGPEYELSPLDQIRQAEAEVARRVAGCREGAERTVAKAREQARALVEAEREAGRQEGWRSTAGVSCAPRMKSVQSVWKVRSG